MHIHRRRLPGEIVFILLLLALSVFLLWTAYGISGFESFTSAGAYPMVTTGVMVVSGLVILFQSLKTPRAAGGTGESLVRQFVRTLTPSLVLAFTVATIAYMLLLERLGFVLASYLFLVGSMWILGSRRFILNLAVSALALGFIYLIFQTIFAVSMPAGTWLQGVLK